MTTDQVLIITILLVTMALFIWNHWRYDVVAGFALLSATFRPILLSEVIVTRYNHCWKT
ncbi:MAG: hypothetical protein V3U65_02625 [Granulosicoccaceae bacterium]